MFKKARSKFLSFIKLFCVAIPVFLLCGCSNKNDINSLEQLRNGNYKIGALNLTYCSEMVNDEFPNASDYLMFNDVAATYQALALGKIDAFIDDETRSRTDIAKGVKDVKILDGHVGGQKNIVAGISPDSKVINKDKIDDVLLEFKNDGTLADMEQRWCKTGIYDMPDIPVPTTADKTLKVITAGVSEPFSFYKNNEVTGFDIELAKRIAVKLNLNLNFTYNSDYEAMVADVQTNKSDLLLASLHDTEERRKALPLSVPYFVTSAVAIVRDTENSDKTYSKLSDLTNKKIGYDASSTQYEGQLDKFLPNCQRHVLNSTADCVTALLSNRIDAYVTDLPNGKYAEIRNPQLKVMTETMDNDNYGFIFRKGSPVTQEFNEKIKIFKERNFISDLEEKWFNYNENTKLTEQDESKLTKGTLKAVTTAILEPMCFLDSKNNIVGFEADLAINICNELGYKLEFLPPVSNFGSAFTSVSEGKADIGINTVSITEERKQKVDMTEPYYNGAVVLVVLNGNVESQGFFEKLKDSFYKTFIVEQRWKMILSGVGNTLIISVSAGIIGVLLAFGLCFIRRGKNKPLNTTAKIIIKLIQGTPIVVFLMIMYYVVFGKVDINAIIVAILAFGINFGVYGAEIMRVGFDTVDKGQLEAATSMGYSRSQVFAKISLPQAAKRFIPTLRGEFISMVKMTSVAGYISVAELTRVGDIIRSKTMEAFFPLIVIALIYFGLSELLVFGLSLAEKKLDKRNKPFKMKGVKIHE